MLSELSQEGLIAVIEALLPRQVPTEPANTSRKRAREESPSSSDCTQCQNRIEQLQQLISQKDILIAQQMSIINTLSDMTSIRSSKQPRYSQTILDCLLSDIPPAAIQARILAAQTDLLVVAKEKGLNAPLLVTNNFKVEDGEQLYTLLSIPEPSQWASYVLGSNVPLKPILDMANRGTSYRERWSDHSTSAVLAFMQTGIELANLPWKIVEENLYTTQTFLRPAASDFARAKRILTGVEGRSLAGLLCTDQGCRAYQIDTVAKTVTVYGMIRQSKIRDLFSPLLPEQECYRFSASDMYPEPTSLNPLIVELISLLHLMVAAGLGKADRLEIEIDDIESERSWERLGNQMADCLLQSLSQHAVQVTELWGELKMSLR